MCSCLSTKISTAYNTEVCMLCGLERSIGVTQEFIYMPGANLNRSYSRNERWRNLIRKITGYHSGPPVRDPVWKYLANHKPFKTPHEIISCLRKSRLVNKHYQNIYIFTKIFAPKFELPKYRPEVCKTLISYFNVIYRLWNRHFGQRPFFSYNWLIEQSLNLFNYTEFLPFVKVLVCPKRRRKYESLITRLCEIHLGQRDCKPPVVHLQCEKSSSLTHRSQSDELLNLYLASVAARKLG